MIGTGGSFREHIRFDGYCVSNDLVLKIDSQNSDADNFFYVDLKTHTQYGRGHIHVAISRYETTIFWYRLATFNSAQSPLLLEK